MSQKTEWYGNQDSKKEFPLNASWNEGENNKIIVRQQRKRTIDGVEQLVDHAHPVQVYDATAYEGMKPMLEDQGIVLTTLHDSSPKGKAKAAEVKPEAKAEDPGTGNGSALVDMHIGQTVAKQAGKK